MRNHDTFVMVNNVDDTIDHKEDCNDVDSLMEKVRKIQKIDLVCLNRNDNQPCPSILRLAKQLIIYNRWLKAISKKSNEKSDINDTIQVNIEEFMDDKSYRIIFAESVKNIKKITKDEMELLMNMFDDNVDDIG
eukprot:13447_1